MTGRPDPAVLVLVGTDHHRFDRLVDWVDRWAAGADGSACLVQYGRSRAPRFARGRDFLGHAEVQSLMRSASVVVSHGGPTTIAEARRFGHRPVVVPRSSALGEHVDDHQVRFSSRLARAGFVRLVGSEEELASAIEETLLVGRGQATGSEAAVTAAAQSFGTVVEQVLRRR